MSEEQAEYWCEVFRRQSHLLLLFLGKGVLELRELGAEALQVPSEAGVLVILRADLFVWRTFSTASRKRWLGVEA